MIINCLLHVHSSFSYDSKTDLSDIAATARRHGFRCVLMSDHNNFMNAESTAELVRRCDELSRDGLLIIPGLELAFDQNRVHLLAYGIRTYIESTSPSCTFASLIDAVHDGGGLAILAHPSHRDAMHRIPPADFAKLDGVEIWNVKNGNRFFPTASELTLLRTIRADGARAFGFAGVDWHHLDKFSPVTIAVDAPALTRDAVLEHLRLGHFEVLGRCASVAPAGESRRTRLLMYKTAGETLHRTRRIAYRWQSAYERRGFKTPRALAAVAKRFW
jgi:PHP domain-containing protein